MTENGGSTQARRSSRLLLRLLIAAVILAGLGGVGMFVVRQVWWPIKTRRMWRQVRADNLERLKRDPKNTEAMRLLGWSCFWEWRRSEAMEHFKRSLELDGETIDNLHTFAAVHAATAHRSTNADEKRMEMEHALSYALKLRALLTKAKLSPYKALESWRSCGWLLGALGKHAEAAACFETALKALADVRQQGELDKVRCDEIEAQLRKWLSDARNGAFVIER